MVRIPDANISCGHVIKENHNHNLWKVVLDLGKSLIIVCNDWWVINKIKVNN